MGLTRDLAPVLIRQFLHSYCWREKAETVVPHHAIRATRTAFPFKELLTRGRRRALPFHSWMEGSPKNVNITITIGVKGSYLYGYIDTKCHVVHVCMDLEK